MSCGQTLELPSQRGDDCQEFGGNLDGTGVEHGHPNDHLHTHIHPNVKTVIPPIDTQYCAVAFNSGLRPRRTATPQS